MKKRTKRARDLTAVEYADMLREDKRKKELEEKKQKKKAEKEQKKREKQQAVGKVRGHGRNKGKI